MAKCEERMVVKGIKTELISLSKKMELNKNTVTLMAMSF